MTQKTSSERLAEAMERTRRQWQMRIKGEAAPAKAAAASLDEIHGRKNTVTCKLCGQTAAGSDLCPVCGYCKACSAGMPETGTCFNCLEVQRLLLEFLNALQEWDVERYGPAAAAAFRELNTLSELIEPYC
jgi:hypothetical protein